MKPLLSCNIDNRGRLVRELVALGLLIGAAFAFSVSTWLGTALLVGGVFAAFEALWGWCVLRACGIKTRL